MKKRREVLCWCIQEHHLDVKTPCKQSLGSLLLFYAYGEDGSSGVCTIVHRDFKPKVVFKHPSRRALDVQITTLMTSMMAWNVYAPNNAKIRGVLWQDLC